MIISITIIHVDVYVAEIYNHTFHIVLYFFKHALICKEYCSPTISKSHCLGLGDSHQNSKCCIRAYSWLNLDYRPMLSCQGSGTLSGSMGPSITHDMVPHIAREFRTLEFRYKCPLKHVI